MIEFLQKLTDPQSIIHYGGLALLLFVVFAETGLLVGFFLPGDNLIFLSGMICISKPLLLNVGLLPLIAMLSAAEILGNCAGYWFGYKVGPPLFRRKDSLLFKKRYLEITHTYYTKYGGKIIIMARFLPVIRTFAPILAGVIRIDFRKFMLYNMAGAIAWTASLAGIGYFLGTYACVREHVNYIFIALIVITLIPLVLAWRKGKKEDVPGAPDNH